MDKNVNSKKISICIPTWEQHGKGASFLEQLFVSIESQTYKNYNVVVSDQSLNDEIKNLCETFSNKFDIIYVKNKKDLGNGPANTNNCIKNADGEIIKIMFQDDFFYDDESLEKINTQFEQNIEWLICGSNHTRDDGHSFYWDLYPKWNDNILNGVNTLGSPSSLAFRKQIFDDTKFDPNLVMMMDCDFYYNVKEKYGYPFYYNDVLVTNRVHSNQISSRYVKDDYQVKINQELLYCKKKYSNKK